MFGIKSILPSGPTTVEEGMPMNVSLTPELEAYVTSKVEEGLYRTNSEVVRQGLRLLMERDRLMDSRIEELRAAVSEGLDQARKGDLIPGDMVAARFDARKKSKKE